MNDNKEIAVVSQPTMAMELITKEKINSYLTTFGLVSKLSKTEVDQFVNIACAFQLNPFKREIYCIPYEGAGGRKLSTIVGYEVYIKRAERTGKLSGWSVTTDGSVAKGDLKATITIHRKDWTYPFTHEVLFSEYNQNNHIWKSKPVTMIKKVCIGTGFRLCFSDELGGMPYTSEELPSNMGHVEVIEPVKSAEPVKAIEVEQVDDIKAEQEAREKAEIARKIAEQKAALAKAGIEAKTVTKVEPKPVVEAVKSSESGLKCVSGEIVNLYPPKSPKGPTNVKVMGSSEYYSTFDKATAELLEKYKAEGSTVEIQYEVKVNGKYSNNLIKIVNLVDTVMPEPMNQEPPMDEAPF